MTAKFTVLGNTTLATASASVTFSSIPGGYKDLVLVADYKGTTSSILNLYWQANSDTTTGNYSVVHMSGDGSATSSSAFNGLQLSPIASPNDTGSALVVCTWLDYSATDKHKSWLLRANTPISTAGAPGVSAIAGRWASTAALTLITLTNQFSRDFAAGSTFRLLGVN